MESVDCRSFGVIIIIRSFGVIIVIMLYVPYSIITIICHKMTELPIKLVIPRNRRIDLASFVKGKSFNSAVFFRAGFNTIARNTESQVREHRTDTSKEKSQGRT